MPSKEVHQEINLQIRRGPIDSRLRQLMINPGFIQFQDKNFGDVFTKFTKDEICEYRYGIKWIRGFEFTIGREYLVFVRNASGESLKISFKTFYGIKKKAYHQLFNEILNALWDFFFSSITNEYYAEFKKGVDIKIGRATLTKEAVIVDEGGILKSDKKTIPWADLDIKEYYTYLAIFSTIDASKAHATFSFLNDWNTVVLHSVVSHILKKRKENDTISV